MLTTREKEVLKLICLSNQEIAERLFITVGTTKMYVHNILNKLVCFNRSEALAKAIKKGIIKVEEIHTDNKNFNL